MKIITVGFSSHKTSILSKLIRLVEGTPYSHTYVKFRSDSLDRDLIYQASGLAVNFMSPIIFHDHNIVCAEYILEVPDEVHKKVLQFAIDNCGKPYGLKGLFGMAYVKIARVFGKKVDNPFSDGGKTYVCSELVSTIIEHFLGKEIGENLDDVSPKDLHCIMQRIRLLDKSV